MDKDRVKGKAKETEGEIQQKWGEAKDKARDGWEDVKDKAEDLGDKAEDRLDEPKRARRGVRGAGLALDARSDARERAGTAGPLCGPARRVRLGRTSERSEGRDARAPRRAAGRELRGSYTATDGEDQKQ